METLFKKHRMLISQTNTKIVREIMKSIDWEKQLVAISGSRGVGKTTLVRQYILETYGARPDKALYCVIWMVCISQIIHYLTLPNNFIIWVVSICSWMRCTNIPHGVRK